MGSGSEKARKARKGPFAVGLRTDIPALMPVKRKRATP